MPQSCCWLVFGPPTHPPPISVIMSLVPLLVIAFSSTSALVTEFLQWYFVWNTPGFKTLKANLAKHVKRADEAKEASAKNLKKREARLENWRKEAGKQVAQYNFKAGIVMMVCMIATYKIMMRLFSGMGAVGQLPFEPPPFLQKVTHRGLTGADPRECSAVFIFVLCQSSVKVVVGKLLNLGMGREFMDILPTMPKGLDLLGEDSKKK